MNERQNVLMEEAQQILPDEYRRPGMESRTISRSQAWIIGLSFLMIWEILGQIFKIL